MKILFITNASALRCGVQAFGAEMIAALRRAGDDVTVHDGSYSVIYETRHYLPPEREAYDVVHFNWDPQAINHYLPVHFAPLEAAGIPLSLFLHDVPPHTTCPVFDVAKWRFGFEPFKDVDVVDEPIPPTPRFTLLNMQQFMGQVPDRDADVIIGLSGVRNDPGVPHVQELCRRRGWQINQPGWWPQIDGQAHIPGTWLSNDEEIRRLAKSTINVCWYHTSGRGKSMAAPFCCAARRPLICSGSTMFSALWPYEDEIYFPDDTYERHGDTWPFALEPLIDEVLRDLRNDEALMPDRVCHELSWDHMIQRIRMRWRGVR